VDQSSGRIRVVSPGYFGVMNIPILSGRDYDEVGEVGSLPSIIVNRALADRFWPGQDAVSRRVQMSWKSSPSTIIGVVGDVRYTGLDADAGNEFDLPEGLYLSPRSDGHAPGRIRHRATVQRTRAFTRTVGCRAAPMIASTLNALGV
jgi:hypothetical protein